MQVKIKFLFFIAISLYLVLIFSLPYVSVYITYIGLPIIILLGILGFVKFSYSIKNIALTIFLGTLILWVITLGTITYVGVYLIWGVVPVLIISGLIWYFSPSKN